MPANRQTDVPVLVPSLSFPVSLFHSLSIIFKELYWSEALHFDEYSSCQIPAKRSFSAVLMTGQVKVRWHAWPRYFLTLSLWCFNVSKLLKDRLEKRRNWRWDVCFDRGQVWLATNLEKMHLYKAYMCWSEHEMTLFFFFHFTFLIWHIYGGKWLRFCP